VHLLQKVQGFNVPWQQAQVGLPPTWHILSFDRLLIGRNGAVTPINPGFSMGLGTNPARFIPGVGRALTCQPVTQPIADKLTPRPGSQFGLTSSCDSGHFFPIKSSKVYIIYLIGRTPGSKNMGLTCCNDCICDIQCPSRCVC
jgi:hypothetical protein